MVFSTIFNVNRTMTNRNYDDAMRVALDFATKAGSQRVAPLVSTRDLRARLERGERVVMVPGLRLNGNVIAR